MTHIIIETEETILFVASDEFQNNLMMDSKGPTNKYKIRKQMRLFLVWLLLKEKKTTNNTTEQQKHENNFKMTGKKKRLNHFGARLIAMCYV